MCIAVTRSYLVWFGIQIAQAMLAGWEKLSQKKNFCTSASSKGFIHFLWCALGISWGKGLYNKPCFPISQNFGSVLGFFYVCLLFVLCLQVWVETWLMNWWRSQNFCHNPTQPELFPLILCLGQTIIGSSWMKIG
jgi:hypothetical protein